MNAWTLKNAENSIIRMDKIMMHMTALGIYLTPLSDVSGFAAQRLSCACTSMQIDNLSLQDPSEMRAPIKDSYSFFTSPLSLPGTCKYGHIYQRAPTLFFLFPASWLRVITIYSSWGSAHSAGSKQQDSPCLRKRLLLTNCTSTFCLEGA